MPLSLTRKAYRTLARMYCAFSYYQRLRRCEYGQTHSYAASALVRSIVKCCWSNRMCRRVTTLNSIYERCAVRLMVTLRIQTLCCCFCQRFSQHKVLYEGWLVARKRHRLHDERGWKRLDELAQESCWRSKTVLRVSVNMDCIVLVRAHACAHVYVCTCGRVQLVVATHRVRIDAC